MLGGKKRGIQTPHSKAEAGRACKKGTLAPHSGERWSVQVAVSLSPMQLLGGGKGEWRQQGGVCISTCEVARMHEFSMGQGTLQKVMEGNTA